jgi:hypothetical protein
MDQDFHSVFRSARDHGTWYFFYHGFVWVRMRGSPGIVNLRCQNRFCRARAKFYILEQVIDVDPDHVHQHAPPLAGI